jgi:putative phosphotransacetylase
MRIPIGISNRHIHLSPSDVEKLFGKWYELKKFKDITQPGQYAAQEFVTIVGEKWSIEKVRVVGPNRKTTQVELSIGDTFMLWLSAPIRISGETNDLGYIKIVGPVGEIYGPFALVAQRHLHCTVKEAQELGIKSGDEVRMQIGGLRGVIFEHVAVRAKDDYALDFHIDIDEANAAGAKPGDRAELIK